MGPLDALWHLLNFLSPAVGVGLIASGLCKLVWWRGLRAVTWRRLAAWATGAGAAALVAGLLLFGHDGRMATYFMLCAATAASLWWAGLRRLA